MKSITYFVNYSGLVESFFTDFNDSLYREGDTVYRKTSCGAVVGEYTAYDSLTDIARVIEGVKQ